MATATIQTENLSPSQWSNIARELRRFTTALTSSSSNPEERYALATSLADAGRGSVVAPPQEWQRWFEEDVNGPVYVLLVALSRSQRHARHLEDVLAQVRHAVQNVGNNNGDAAAAPGTKRSARPLDQEEENTTGGQRQEAPPQPRASPVVPEPAFGVSAVLPLTRRGPLVKALEDAPTRSVDSACDGKAAKKKSRSREPYAPKDSLNDQSRLAVEEAIALARGGSAEARSDVLTTTQSIARRQQRNEVVSAETATPLPSRPPAKSHRAASRSLVDDPVSIDSSCSSSPVVQHTRSAARSSVVTAPTQPLKHAEQRNENVQPPPEAAAADPALSRLLAVVGQRSSSTGLSAAAAAAANATSVSSAVCGVCMEGGGDIFKCRFCRKWLHEACGGPRPDHPPAQQRCSACSHALGLKPLTSSDDDEEGDDEEETTDAASSMGGFIVNDSDSSDLDPDMLLGAGSDASSDADDTAGSVRSSRSDEDGSSDSSGAVVVQQWPSARGSRGGRGGRGGRAGRAGRGGRGGAQRAVGRG